MLCPHNLEEMQVSDAEVTGMTERAMFCMLPEKQGGCDETENLVPIHWKVVSEVDGSVERDEILGWLCKPHALELALKNAANPGRGSYTVEEN